jgi:hypothetical protein
MKRSLPQFILHGLACWVDDFAPSLLPLGLCPVSRLIGKFTGKGAC